MAILVTTPSGLRHLAVTLRALVAHVLKGERRRAGEIGVRLTDDTELRELNRRWRGIDRATDVISFAYDEHEPDATSRPVTGDLVLSLERVIEQAGRFRVTVGAELARLVIHGTLHLAGHDHQRPAQRRAMRAREDALLRSARVLVRRLEPAASAARPRRTAPAR